MYVPPPFQINEHEKLVAFMSDHSFATLVSSDAGSPVASHLPLRCVADDNNGITLVGHMARANPQWKYFDGESELLVIFQGPHSYISPTWYSVEPAVPTWNYAAVHGYGVPAIIEDHERVVAILFEAVGFYEQGFDKPWSGELPAEYQAQLIDAIVVFEIKVTRIEGQYKLGQNRSETDQQRVREELVASSDPSANELAKLMETEGLSCVKKPTAESMEGNQKHGI